MVEQARVWAKVLHNTVIGFSDLGARHASYIVTAFCGRRKLKCAIPDAAPEPMNRQRLRGRPRSGVVGIPHRIPGARPTCPVIQSLCYVYAFVMQFTFAQLGCH